MICIILIAFLSSYYRCFTQKLFIIRAASRCLVHHHSLSALPPVPIHIAPTTMSTRSLNIADAFPIVIDSYIPTRTSLRMNWVFQAIVPWTSHHPRTQPLRQFIKSAEPVPPAAIRTRTRPCTWSEIVSNAIHCSRQHRLLRTTTTRPDQIWEILVLVMSPIIITR